MRIATETLPERVRRNENLLSASQRKIARFCISQPREASDLTALRIANQLGVSESTVVRFALRMGYDGFPDMKAALRATTQDRALRESAGEVHERDFRVHQALSVDNESLRETIARFDFAMLHECGMALHQARRVHVAGFRSSFGLAFLAEFHMRPFKDTRLIDAGGGTFADDIALIGPDDALLAFTFPVYDERTLKSIEVATELGVPSVVITDSALAPLPINPLVRTLVTRHESTTFFNSAVAPAALLNALLVRLLELASQEDRTIERRVYDRFQKKREH